MTKKETQEYLPKQKITEEFTKSIERSLERIEKDATFFVKFLGLFLASNAEIRQLLMKQDLRVLEAEMRQAVLTIAALGLSNSHTTDQQTAQLKSLKALQIFSHRQSVELWKRSLHQTLIERDTEVTDRIIAAWLLLIDKAFDGSTD